MPPKEPDLTAFTKSAGEPHSSQLLWLGLQDPLYRREADRPNALWQADHTPLDLWVRDQRNQPARPWPTNKRLAPECQFSSSPEVDPMGMQFASSDSCPIGVPQRTTMVGGLTLLAKDIVPKAHFRMSIKSAEEPQSVG